MGEKLALRKFISIVLISMGLRATGSLVYSQRDVLECEVFPKAQSVQALHRPLCMRMTWAYFNIATTSALPQQSCCTSSVCKPRPKSSNSITEADCACGNGV